MIGSVNDPVDTRARAAGGPRPGTRWPSSRPWRDIVVVVAVATLLTPLFIVATGCSSKPAAKKRGKARATAKRPETGLADLADEAGARTPDAADSVAGGASDPAAETAALPPADSSGSSAAAAEEPETAAAPLEPAGPVEPMPPAASAPTSADAAPPAVPLDAPAGDGQVRPTSKLIDADTALLLDGGRVEVCSPIGWTRSPRSQNYLVRYQPGPRKTFPSIVVTAEPAPEGLGEVTDANQPRLVAAIGAKLAETFPADGAVKLLKKPAAATFGSHKGVAWAMPGTAKVGGLSEPIERFAFGVVLGGRLYTVETRAPKGKVDDDAKAAAKAVAATLFRPAEAPAGNPESGAPPAEGSEPPADN